MMLSFCRLDFHRCLGPSRKEERGLQILKVVGLRLLAYVQPPLPSNTKAERNVDLCRVSGVSLPDLFEVRGRPYATIRSMEVNPVAPGNFAENRTFKIVDRFPGHFRGPIIRFRFLFVLYFAGNLLV